MANEDQTDASIVEATRRINAATQAQIDAAKRREELGVNDIAKIDTIHHPRHYGGDTVYETIKVIEAWGLGFSLGNCIKYISRAGKKDGSREGMITDLEKARFYLDRAIDNMRQGRMP